MWLHTRHESRVPGCSDTQVDEGLPFNPCSRGRRSSTPKERVRNWRDEPPAKPDVPYGPVRQVLAGRVLATRQ